MIVESNGGPPLSILHLTAGSDAGGLSRYIVDLCTAMRAQGHSVAVAGQRGAWHRLFETASIPWIEAPMKGGIFSLGRARRDLTDYLNNHTVDLLHVHYRKPAVVARKLQRQFHAPILYTLHLSHISLARPRRWLTDFGDHVHVASTEARQWMIEQARIPADCVTLIPHGIDPDQFPIADMPARNAARQALRLDDDAIVAAYVGRLDVPKNEDWLLDLAARTRQSLPNLRIILAGEGPHEGDLRRRIAAENLADRVVLLGHREPLQIYHAADALLLPSTREGFSLACAEAMCAGIPVLRTQTSGTAELIIEGVTGESTPIDRDVFISRAQAFLSQPQKLKTMGIAAAQHIRGSFAFSRQVQQTIELYRRLIRSGSSIAGTSSGSPAR